MKIVNEDGRTVATLENYADLLVVRALPDYQFVDRDRVQLDPRHLAEIGKFPGRRPRFRRQLATHLFDYQAWVVQRAFERERFAAFMLTGLGKTVVQLEWARLVARSTGGRVLLVAPLNVCGQTIGMAQDFYGHHAGYAGLYVHDLTDRANLDGWLAAEPGSLGSVGITNYEKLDGIETALPVAGVVLDESSMLRSIGGSRKWSVVKAFAGIRYKLCCSATPAPNDRTEYAQHAVFLDQVRSTKEYLTAYFRNDGKGNWDFKTHAYDAWVANLSSWAVFMHDPGRWGFTALPDMPELIESNPSVELTEDQMIRARRYESGERQSMLGADVGGITSRTKLQQIANGFELFDEGSRVETFPANKPSEVVWIVDTLHRDEQCIVWVHFDHEGNQLEDIIPSSYVGAGHDLDVVHLSGKTPMRRRMETIEAFRRGEGPRVLILKPAMFAQGLNLQACTVQVFSSVHDSFERYFQCIRRSWRFGQTKPVTVYVPLTVLDQAINTNVLSKQSTFLTDAEALESAVVARLRPADTSEVRTVDTTPKIEIDRTEGDGWTMVLADSLAHMATMEPRSVDLAVFSPPFPALFAYSKELGDVANVRGTAADTSEHRLVWQWFAEGLLPLMRPGRLVAIHCKEIIQPANVHGYRWCYDYPSELREGMEAAGFHYHRRVTIAKNPQALRHGQRVLAPTGWVPIEEIDEGEQVIGSDGLPTKVEGVWPQGTGSIYRVTFSDGASVECDAAHRWTVRTLAGRKTNTWRTITTEDLMLTGLKNPTGKRRWEVPIVRPVVYSPMGDLPLDPYLIGALLGDGMLANRSTVGLCTQRHVARRVAERLPVGHTIREADKSSRGDDCATFYIGHPEWHRNDVLARLHQLDMHGKRSWEKRIPFPYLQASVMERLELLRGLLDTDGTIKRNGSVWYGTTSEGLARDVIELVQSLGGVARLRCETKRRYVHLGEERNGRPCWLVSIALDGDAPVTLPHKVERWKPVRRQWHREIAEIEYVGEDERTCITVANDDGLFVTEGFVLTHNSEATRNKETSLLHVTVKRNALHSMPQAGEYLMVFAAPGEAETPVPHDDIDFEMWCEWANSIWPDWAESSWQGIRETDVLNTEVAREKPDERHVCPLQLGLIERVVRLWSNPGELVFSPFAGIGSEGWEAIAWGRRFYGIELKESYYRTAVTNLRRRAADVNDRVSLFEEAAS